MLPTLETERLVLRPLEERDATSYFAIKRRIAEHEECRGFLLGARYATIDAVAERIRAFHADATIRAWAIVRREDDEVVGVIAFIRGDAASARAEISYEIDPLHWGKGYAPEALTRLVACGFNELALHRVEAWIDTRNARSSRVAERAGFVREGILREHTLSYGTFADMAIYAKLAQK